MAAAAIMRLVVFIAIPFERMWKRKMKIHQTQSVEEHKQCSAGLAGHARKQPAP